MNWDQVVAQVGVAGVAIAALAWVARALITNNLAKSVETHKAELRREVDTAIERLRLHDQERTNAHKRLFVFAKKAEDTIFPMAEDKKAALVKLMDDLYWGKVQLDQVYFSDTAHKTLDQFAEAYSCATHRDLVQDHPELVEGFLEGAFGQARLLAEYAREATHSARDVAT